VTGLPSIGQAVYPHGECNDFTVHSASALPAQTIVYRLAGATLSFVLSAAVMSGLSLAQSPLLMVCWGVLMLLSLLVQLLMLVLLAKKP
jgi:hypothetical protein